jgi:enolase
MSHDRIAAVKARGLYDSNGQVTVEATVVDEAGRHMSAIAPRGSTVGDFEPRQMEDVTAQPSLAAAAPAVTVVAQRVEPALVGIQATDLVAVDGRLDELDPTPLRSSIGGNVTIATSMAAARLGAVQRGVALHEHLRDFIISERPPTTSPRPAFNIIDGGRSPESRTPHIEFLLFPRAHLSLADTVEVGIKVFDQVKRLCHDRSYEGGGSEQGGVSIPLRSCEEGLDMLEEAVRRLNLEDECWLGLDMAASDVWRDNSYHFLWADEPMTFHSLLSLYTHWIRRFKLRYIEDGFAASQAEEFATLTSEVDESVMVAGDDLFASAADRIRSGATGRWANTAVVKPNQAGTTTATLRAAAATHAANWSLVVSQRSGENGGSFISSLAIATAAEYVKVGGPTRMDRVAKINQLIRVLVSP